MSGRRRGVVVVMVLVALTVSLIFATYLMRRSVSQGYEKLATRERTQLELLCLSAIDAAKLKIKAHPTELYTAFRYRHDETGAKKTDDLYRTFLSDLQLDVLDESLIRENATLTARVTAIERLGITRKATGLGPGYVDDYLRITASAASRIPNYGKDGLESEVTMQVTIQITKKEGT